MARLDLKRWTAASPHLDRALDLDEDGRARLLDEIARTDPSLADDVRALLGDYRDVVGRGFLEHGQTALPDMQLERGQTIGPYALVEPLGSGGMGTVWLAERHDGRFERRVAIKFLNVGLVGLPAGQRFHREGALLAQLRHPNIAELLDAGLLPGGRPYLVLEHVDGLPIDVYCDREGLDVEQRVRLMLQVTGAVQHAHAHLIVHRDLKPANVMVTRDGNVKLLDFGIAKLLVDSAAMPGPTLTREHGAALTPEYAAPEQVAGEPVSTATDVYALGLLLYVVLAGRHPIGAAVSNPAGLVRAILETEPQPVSKPASETEPQSGADADIAIAQRRSTTPDRLRRTLRGDLDTIVAKALRKVPAERYASVEALAHDLQCYLSHEPIRARPDTALYRARRFVRRNRGAVASFALAMVAVIGGAAIALLQAQAARTQRDFALQQLERAEALNDLNNFLLVDAAPGGKPFTVNSLLEQAERIVMRQRTGEAARANLLIGIGEQYAALEEVDRSKEVLERAYEASHRSNVPTVKASAACNLAETLVLAGDPERAQRLIDEGLAQVPAGHREGELVRASCLLSASRVAREAGSTDKAIEYAQAAKAAQARAPYRSHVLDLRTERDLAESYNQAGRFLEANAAFAHGALQLESLGRDETLAAGTLYNNWALSLSVLGRPIDAEPLYRKAIEISRDGDTNDAVAPMLLVNYGRALREVGRTAEAAKFAEDGNAKARAAGHAVVVNQSLIALATIYRELGRLDDATKALDEVEPRLREALPAGHYAFAALAQERAQLLLALGRGEEALRVADDAVAIAEADRRATGRSHAVPRVLVRRAEVRLGVGQPGAAAADASAALKLLQADAPADLRTNLMGQAYLSLGQALIETGDRNAGLAALNAAIEHLASAVGPEHPQTIRANQLAAAARGS